MPSQWHFSEQKWKLSMSWVICIICSSFANSLPHESQDFMRDSHRLHSLTLSAFAGTLDISIMRAPLLYSLPDSSPSGPEPILHQHAGGPPGHHHVNIHKLQQYVSLCNAPQPSGTLPGMCSSRGSCVSTLLKKMLFSIFLYGRSK